MQGDLRGEGLNFDIWGFEILVERPILSELSIVLRAGEKNLRCGTIFVRFLLGFA